MVILTVMVGILAWAVLDYIIVNEVRNTFIAQLNERLKKQSKEARLNLNNYMKAHSQLVRLIADKKKFVDYCVKIDWLSKPYETFKYHKNFPEWFVNRSILRVLASPRFVILYDDKRRAREVYHRPTDSLPHFFLTLSEMIVEKSHHQSYITSIEEVPFLLSSEFIFNPQGQRITLMLASPIDDELLTLSQKNSPDRLIALLSEDSNHILTSSDITRVRSGDRLDELKNRYLATGYEYFEYGDAEVRINLVSFLSTQKADEMVGRLVSRDRQQRAIMASILIMLSALVMFFITRRIVKLTRHLSDFSKEALGGKVPESGRGDELTILENRFQLLIEEVVSSHQIIRRDAEENAIKKVEFRTKERLYRLLRSVTDAMGIGVLSMYEKKLSAANDQMEKFRELCGGLDVFEMTESDEQEKTITDTHGQSHVFQLTSPVLSTDEKVILVRDITENRNLKDQLQQLQKMNAVGQMAGGIAHDFNNILHAVIGYADLLKKELGDSPLSGFIDEILYSSKRGTSLIRSLLAFSRKQTVNLKPVNLNEVVKNVEKLLLRLIGEDVELKTNLLDKDIIIHADAIQVEHVLINMATNARDAMPSGGLLTISTETVIKDKMFLEGKGNTASGEFAMLSVLDNGVGMPQQTKEKIFEPFFTTKEVGEGSGLGLSMAYGIILQHNGHIEVYSESGSGTLFEIYLPVVNMEIEEPVKKISESDSSARGTETVLLAEDDCTVRQMMKDILEQHGYSVIEAEDGEDAVRKFMENKDSINLFLSDVIMPKKDGKTAYEELKAVKPDIKVLFVSGYSGDKIYKKGIAKEDMRVMLKPFSAEELLNQIREVLDGSF